MRWTIMLQCDDGSGNVQTAEVLTLERDVEPAFSMLGLLNCEAKRLLLRLQQRFARQQAAAFSQHIRPCSKCGIDRNIKDYRPRTLHSLFGNVVMRIPRYHRCICEQIGSGRLLRYIWPGTRLLPTGRVESVLDALIRAARRGYASKSWLREHQDTLTELAGELGQVGYTHPRLDTVCDLSTNRSDRFAEEVPLLKATLLTGMQAVAVDERDADDA